MLQVGALRGVVALDGPSGTGKSTVAQRLAADLGAHYLDTGAMYRAAALGVLRDGVDPADPAAVSATVERLSIDVGTDPGAAAVTLDGLDVSAEIRSAPVTSVVSPVSAVPEVRTLLVAQQREIIGTAAGIVVEGRDIGTVVAPDAPLKVFLTATPAQRAQRRASQDGVSDLDVVRRSVEWRDRLDSTRAASPLRPADDAVELDTTELDATEVLAALHELVAQRGLLVVVPSAPRGRP
ncbi:MAG: (d)CMP kinase [Pseudonocardiaceae bacterium]|nr:(d)CMP kinase [Pseudonocardiaceae bacterium]